MSFADNLGHKAENAIPARSFHPVRNNNSKSSGDVRWFHDGYWLSAAMSRSVSLRIQFSDAPTFLRRNSSDLIS